MVRLKNFAKIFYFKIENKSLHFCAMKRVLPNDAQADFIGQSYVSIHDGEIWIADLRCLNLQPFSMRGN